jgi:hypothetical protein
MKIAVTDTEYVPLCMAKVKQVNQWQGLINDVELQDNLLRASSSTCVEPSTKWKPIP